MKKTFTNYRLVVFAVLFTMSLAGVAVGVRVGAQEKLPQPAGHVNDFAGVIEPAGKQRLETVLERLKERTSLDLVVAIVKTVGSDDLYDYSLRVASDWNVGTRMSPRKGVLLLIATDTGQFFTQFSRAAQTSMPDGLIGEMGKRMRPKFAAGDYNGGLLAGVQKFADALGEPDNFTFAQLDPQSGEVQVAQTRPRTVEPQATPADSPTPAPTETPTPEASPSPTPAETPSQLPTETPTPEPSPSATPTETPAPAETSTPEPSVTPTPSPVDSPQPEMVTPNPTSTPAAEPTEAPPAATPAPSASPLGTPPVETATTNPGRPPRSPATGANPEDEKEEVEVTLSKPAAERIEILKAFIASHPKSVAVPRAYELIVAARATVADQKLQAGDVTGGLEDIRLAFAETPGEMTDWLFTEVIARIPMNLFLRGLREAALQTARQAEALAKLVPHRLLAVTQFYLAIENVSEANRLAELTVQTAPDLAAAHHALGAARHISLRLEDAEAEYARALALNPKSTSAKLALADLKRASGQSEAALTLYREVAETDPKNNSARAGIVLSLLELDKKIEAEQELSSALQDPEKARNLALLVGASYWFMAHDNAAKALELAQRAVAIEPRYSWAQISLARALVADKRPLDAERALRLTRQFGRFPTLDYELATVLASVGLYDEALGELARSFSLKDGQVETKLAGRSAARAATFGELLSLERRASIFQRKAADSEANAAMLKGLLAFNTAISSEGRTPSEEQLLTAAQEFIGGSDPMRTYRQVYVATKLLKKGAALSSVLELMDNATAGIEAALDVPAATIAVQPEELSDARARALGRGATPDIPNAPRAALSGLLRGRIEDLAGMALFNLDKPAEAVSRLRRAVSVSPEGTPLWRSTMWHLGAALEASGRNDQALLYYIKSYVTGAPDPARRSVIESVYKKVNGTLDGLDDKIGPAFSTAAPTPKPSP